MYRVFRHVVRKFPELQQNIPAACNACRYLISKTSIPNIRCGGRKGVALVGGGLLSLSFLGFGKKEEKEEDVVITLMKRAKLCQMKNDVVGAEKYYHDALTEVNKKRAASRLTDKEFLYAVVNINDSLAELALVQGNLETAVVLYKEVMKGCLQIGLEKDDNAIMEISIKLASIFAMQNKPNDSRLGYLHCIGLLEKKIKGDKSPDDNTKALFGLALDSFSRFLLMQREYANAEKYLLQSHEIASEVLGNEHPQTLVILNSLATINIMRKQYDQAEKNVKQAIEVGGRTNSPDLPVFYCNLGAIHMRRGLYTEAKSACLTAKVLSEKANNDVSRLQAERCLEKLKEKQNKK